MLVFRIFLKQFVHGDNAREIVILPDTAQPPDQHSLSRTHIIDQRFCLCAFQLLFATNYFSAITPQGSSANLLFAGSGFLSQRDLYQLGGITTAVNMALYLLIGTPWLLLVVS